MCKDRPKIRRRTESATQTADDCARGATTSSQLPDQLRDRSHRNRKSERRRSRKQAPIQTQITKAAADLADAGRDQRHRSEERSRTGGACKRSPEKGVNEARTRRAACASGAGVNAYRLRRKQMTKPVRTAPLARKAPACACTDLITRRRGERRLVPPSIKPWSRSPTQHLLSSKTRRSRKTLESQSTANSRRTT